MSARVRVGFAGCGEVAAEKHMPAVGEVPDIEIAAAADVLPDRLEYVGRRFGVRRCYDDVSAMLAGGGGLDVVALCLPPAAQVPAALAALDAGLHVWIDPPTGLSMAECDRLMERARRSERMVTVGFHMRWHRLVRATREILLSGRLGRVHTIRGIWSSPRQPARLKEWRRYRRLGGGALGEPAIDHFDLWCHLLGAELDTVFAETADDEWEDAAAVISGRMTNDVLVTAVLSERANHDVELEIYGDAGRLRVSLVQFDGLELYEAGALASGPRHRLGRLVNFAKELPRALPRMHRAGDYRTSYRDQWRHFLERMRLGRAAESTLAEGRNALAAMLAAHESAATGQPVRVADIAAGRLPSAQPFESTK
jgi:predicted dehydrogenase